MGNPALVGEDADTVELLVVPNVGAAEGCDAEAPVGSTAETLGATAVADVAIALGLAAGAPVSVVAGFDG